MESSNLQVLPHHVVTPCANLEDDFLSFKSIVSNLAVTRPFTFFAILNKFKYISIIMTIKYDLFIYIKSLLQYKINFNL